MSCYVTRPCLFAGSPCGEQPNLEHYEIYNNVLCIKARAQNHTIPSAFIHHRSTYVWLHFNCDLKDIYEMKCLQLIYATALTLVRNCG